MSIVPADISRMPNEISIMPTEISIVPTEIPIMPSDISILPAEMSLIPTEISLMPSEMALMPTEMALMPTEEAIVVGEPCTSDHVIECKQPVGFSEEAVDQYRALVLTECGLKITTSENYLKRLQDLRKELDYINETEWMYDSLERRPIQ